MSQLLKGPHLMSEICSLFEDAEQYIFITCPFISLHQYYMDALKSLNKKPHVSLKILFGKYSNNDHYKLSDDDFTFLSSLPNTDIRYNSKLHAKYYANEKKYITTSLNMNYTSHNNNYEYGLLFRSHLDKSCELRQASQDLYFYLYEVFESSEVVLQTLYKEKPVAKKVNSHTKRIENIRNKYPNAYEKWSPEDDDKLEVLYCEGLQTEELAEVFKRQPSAIRSRINKLELIEKYGY